MNNHVNSGGVPYDRKDSPYSSLVRFKQPASNPYTKMREMKQYKKPGPVIYEWQLFDETPEKSRKEEGGNLYVSDWQIISY